ncbi:hypothetical protein ACNQO6_00390 [Acinetobacter calcoaceticus]|uniref:hypothetical protein n=1 Tax=Acinetobacter calcoaceticus TaxID=471 RepID=UPI002B2F2C7B|nr:hypothetical protein SB581_07705 [Acinetobacter baumannii]
MMQYIPDLDQQEENLITAKIDSLIEKLRKKRDARILSYTEKETNISFKKLM